MQTSQRTQEDVSIARLDQFGAAAADQILRFEPEHGADRGRDEGDRAVQVADDHGVTGVADERRQPVLALRARLLLGDRVLERAVTATKPKPDHPAQRRTPAARCRSTPPGRRSGAAGD